MMKLWRILPLIIIIVLAIVGMFFVLGFAIGIGWLMTLFLPFTLFEASLLAIIASIVVGTGWYNIFGATAWGGQDLDDLYDEDEDDFDIIPSDRFYKPNDKTWEAWLRHHLANSIYYQFQESPQPVAQMGTKQLQELAIRLADLSITLLKAKTTRAKKISVTPSALKKQMDKIGQRPYDDDILGLATAAINEELAYHYEELIEIIKAKSWNQPYDGLEYKGEF